MISLVKKQVEKVWGKDILPSPFTASGTASGTGRIGEIWFEPPASMPSILVKYIFTSEKLSVQVHPNDAQALAFGETDQGKEECWLVLEAEPGATLGIGFREPLDNQAMHKAACDGTIEALMEWYPVSRGDFFYIPAGTVHGLVTVLRRSPERFKLAAGDRRDDQAYRRVQARGSAHCAGQRFAARPGRIGFGDRQVDAGQVAGAVSAVRSGGSAAGGSGTRE